MALERLVEQPWSEEGEEEGGLLFRAHLSHCGLREEASPCGAQAWFPAPPEPYLAGKGRLLSGQSQVLSVLEFLFSSHDKKCFESAQQLFCNEGFGLIIVSGARLKGRCASFSQ